MDIAAFPCNQFGLQEPGDNDELLNGIKYVRPGNGFIPNFEIFAKLEVNGETEHPMYAFLKKSCPSPSDVIGDAKEEMFWTPIKTTDASWNFEKFLADDKGIPRYRFHPSIDPMNITAYVEELINVSNLEQGIGGR